MSTIKADAITASTGTNTNIAVTGKGSGKVAIGDGTLLFPDADGAAGTAIVTNGSGTLSFAATGKVVQLVKTEDRTSHTMTTVTPKDNTIPTTSEGHLWVELDTAITPTNASNILRIEVEAFLANSAAVNVVMSLFQDSGTNAISAMADRCAAANQQMMTSFVYYMVAGTTSATTFHIYMGPESTGTLTINGHSGGRMFGGVALSSMTITEISV